MDIDFSNQNNNSAIFLVKNILDRALEIKASDVHLEPSSSSLRIRYRIDGLLSDANILEEKYISEIVARIKVLAEMNISERRIPQDGKFSYNFKNAEFDLRIATFPTVKGEKVVIRILRRNTESMNLDLLGLEQDLLNKIKKISKNSSGFFLSTGPTGSGKTTTLHSMLSLINSSEKNIVTLEDPVEYSIEGIMQSQVNYNIDFTFEKGIRSLLRQDPDVIMVGEIRDRETAQVSIQAALTGHLVLSTLHTNDAASAIMRFIDMKIEPFLINASLTGVLGQRLLRKLCNFCKFSAIPNKDEEKFLKKLDLNLNEIFKSSGCENCLKTGYNGRTGVFEFIEISHELRNLITNEPNFSGIHKQANIDGMIPMLKDAAYKIKLGITSLNEVARVLF